MITISNTTCIILILISFSRCSEAESPLSTESDAEDERGLTISEGKDSPMGFTPMGSNYEKALGTLDIKKNVANDDSVPEIHPESSLINNKVSETIESADSELSTTSSEEDTEDMGILFNSTMISTDVTPESEDLVSMTNNSCPFGSRRCKHSQTFPTDLEDKEKKELPTTLVFPSSPIWNVVKSLKSLREDFTRLKSRMITSSKRLYVMSPTMTYNPFSTTSAETSENVILVDTTDISKDESNIADDDEDSIKSEKAKPPKFGSEIPGDKLPKSSLKVIPTPLIIPTKSLSFMNTPTVPLLLSSNFETLMTSGIFEDFTLKSPTYATESFFPPHYINTDNKMQINTDDKYSTSVRDNKPNELNVPFIFPTETNNIHIPTSIQVISKRTTEINLPLSPSFQEYSPSVATSVVENVSSLLSVTSTKEITKQDSVSPVMETNLYTGQVVKDHNPGGSTNRPARPRLTNPSCLSLPMCVEITLLQTTWDQFCAQVRDFQEFLTKVVSQYMHQVQARHIVLEAEACNNPVRPIQSIPDIAVAFYVTDDTGEYEERLTEICGLILRRWAPTSYRDSIVEVRLHSGELQSTVLPIIPEMSSGFAAAIAISTVAGVALCLLCILLLVMKQKLAMQARSPDTATPSGPDAYSLDSLSISASFRRRRNRRSYLNHAFSDHEIPSHPLNEKGLANCLKNKDILEEEFRKIPMNMPKLDSIPEGAHVKNRYSNILPRPESRVVLSVPSGDDLKSYINANFVKGYGGKSSFYIACQAPLPEGIEDFWRMIWDQQSKVIIMLTLFEENTVSRCAVYFPQSTLITLPPFGDFQVTLLKKDVYEFYTVSSLRVLDMEKNLFRDVVHLWYTGWPDVGVPKDPSTLTTFIQQCRSHVNRNTGPTIVHCSTGTGRTGVFLALDMCMREYEESSSVDVLQCVCQLRSDRAGAVQNKNQYILIHEVMLDFVSRVGNGQTQRPSISKTP